MIKIATAANCKAVYGANISDSSDRDERYKEKILLIAASIAQKCFTASKDLHSCYFLNDHFKGLCKCEKDAAISELRSKGYKIETWTDPGDTGSCEEDLVISGWT